MAKFGVETPSMSKNYLNDEAKKYAEALWSTPEGLKALEYLRSRGFEDATIVEFQVGYAPIGSGPFSGRVIFPVFDTKNRCCGFSGRVFGSNSAVKYLNSSESAVFKKTHMLFGLNLARETIFKANRALVCEGFTDVMAFHQVGKTHAVAPMGTALTKNHLQQLARYTNRLDLCFDMDKAGRDAYAKALLRAQKLGFHCRRITLPVGKDPADVLLPS